MLIDTYADVDIPDISFYGEDISTFYVGPSFSSVKLSYDNKTSYDIYLEKISLESEDIEKQEYDTENPGFFYSGRFFTNMSSIFVGEKAFRNYIVKKFLKKDYFSVLDGFNRYSNKLKNTKYYDEVTFLYSISLKSVGNATNAIDNLTALVRGGSEFASYAEDILYPYLYDIKDYERLLSINKDVKKLSPYALYIILNVLMEANEYAKILDLVSANINLPEGDNLFNEYAIMAYYFMGDYDNVLVYKDKATDRTRFFIIDAAINKSNISLAENLMLNLKDEEMIHYFKGRFSLLENNISELEKQVNSLSKDSNKVNLMFLYLQKYFPEIDIAFLDGINFNDISNKDYVYFYSGLYSIKHNDYYSALNFFQRIAFNNDLMEESYFYTGRSYINLDKERAKHYLTKYINEGSSKQKILAARYFLGNIYFSENDMDKALIVISDCMETYCLDLKTRIYINKKEFDKAVNIAGDLSEDRKNYYNAVVAYNDKNYENAINFLKGIQNSDIESDNLLMLSYFKMDKLQDALAIFNKYRELPTFKKQAINYLFLAGQYDKVIELTDDDNEPYILLTRAKSYYSLKKFKAAQLIFEDLVKKNKYLFDSIFSLINIYKKNYNENQYIEKSVVLITKYNFDRKDYLVLSLANQEVDSNINMSIRLINYFFDEFKNSIYLDDAYITRAKLFEKIKKYDQCIADTTYLLKKNSSNYEAMFLQANCLEKVDKKKATEAYINLTEGDNAYLDVSFRKVVETSEEPDILLKAANYFENNDENLYLRAMIKYLNNIDEDKLATYEEFINKLKLYKDAYLSSAGYFLYGKLKYQQQEYKVAADSYVKSYYLNEKGPFAKKALDIAFNAYKKVNDEVSANKIKKLIK